MRRRADLFMRIPMRGVVGSLNAAVAGSILLFEALAQRDPNAAPRAALDLPDAAEATPELPPAEPKPRVRKGLSTERAEPEEAAAAAEPEEAAAAAPPAPKTRARKAGSPEPAAPEATTSKSARKAKTAPTEAAPSKARTSKTATAKVPTSKTATAKAPTASKAKSPTQTDDDLLPADGAKKRSRKTAGST